MTPIPAAAAPNPPPVKYGVTSDLIALIRTGSISDTSVVTLMSNPAPNTRRRILYFVINNRDTVAQTIKVFVDAGPDMEIFTRLVAAGSQLIFGESGEFLDLNVNHTLKAQVSATPTTVLHWYCNAEDRGA